MSGSREFKPTPAQAEGYAVRKSAEANADAQKHVANVQAVAQVMGELVSCAKSNPLIGVVLAAIVADVLSKAGIIRANTANFIFTCTGVAFGISAAASGADIIVNFLDAIDPFKSTGSVDNPAALITPVATTLVENPVPGVPPGAQLGGSGGALGGLLRLSELASA